MSPIKTATIRPGILVALKSSITGGVAYRRVDLEAQEANAARWETTRVIDDPEEHARASKARSAARTEIVKLCSSTTFGLLCPIENELALDQAIARARAIADEHNANAASTRVSVAILKGRIAATDEEAARAIVSEMSDLIAEMNAGIDKLDPEAIRKAADRARELSNMLGDDAQEAAQAAIDQARKAARQIVKRIEKEGEDQAFVIADIQRGALERARIAFLDVEDAEPVVDASPAQDLGRVAGLDVEDPAVVEGSN